MPRNPSLRLRLHSPTAWAHPEGHSVKLRIIRHNKYLALADEYGNLLPQQTAVSVDTNLEKQSVTVTFNIDGDNVQIGELK